MDPGTVGPPLDIQNLCPIKRHTNELCTYLCHVCSSPGPQGQAQGRPVQYVHLCTRPAHSRQSLELWNEWTEVGAPRPAPCSSSSSPAGQQPGGAPIAPAVTTWHSATAHGMRLQALLHPVVAVNCTHTTPRRPLGGTKRHRKRKPLCLGPDTRSQVAFTGYRKKNAMAQNPPDFASSLCQAPPPPPPCPAGARTRLITPACTTGLVGAAPLLSPGAQPPAAPHAQEPCPRQEHYPSGFHLANAQPTAPPHPSTPRPCPTHFRCLGFSLPFRMESPRIPSCLRVPPGLGYES